MDPASHGSYAAPEGSRPPGAGDRCPFCGHKMEWVDVYASNGLGQEWWLGADGACSTAYCGVEFHYEPNRHDRVTTRRHDAVLRYEKSKHEQMELL